MATLVVHACVPGRLRVHVTDLLDNEPLADRLQKELLGRQVIRSVTVSTLTGNLLLEYNSSLQAEDIIKDVDDALLVALSIKPAACTSWGSYTAEQTLSALSCTVDGLSLDEVARRHAEYGRNTQRVVTQSHDWERLANQFNSLPIILLCASTALSLVTGGLLDAVLVGGVIAANVVIGFVTERNAELLIESFIKNDLLTAIVRRDGIATEVPVDDLVPGDLVVLTAGSIIGADMRIIESMGLTVDESILTGESVPVTKLAEPLADTDRGNMAYCGTTVTSGSGIAAVVATGFSTEIGQINLTVAGTQRNQTPMQRQIDRLGTQLTSASVLAAIGVFGLGWLHGMPTLDLVKRATALAVASIPEGLPTVATSILATGLRVMRDQAVLIRTLNAVETLGSVDVICMDKTGTLTRNVMEVTEFTIEGREIATTDGQFMTSESQIEPTNNIVLMELLRVATLCNESEVSGEQSLIFHGSSTENALLLAATQAGIDVGRLREAYPRLRVAYRNETQRYMTTTHDVGDGEFRAVKGNPLDVLALCTMRLSDAEVHPLDPAERQRISDDNDRMAERGLRVLGFACALDQAEEESGVMIWLGMVGMRDPARPGMRPLIDQFRQAGIRPVMLTGDQIGTATAIAKDVELAPAIIAHDLSTTALSQDVLAGNVFARVTPLHKLHVVRALQEGGHVIAMIGDGTNDGPALRAADIGITLGVNGTDAARNIADVVLARDDLETMIIAVRHGRAIYDNIRKAIHFLVSTNSSEVMLTVGATAFGISQPLNTAQLLWINLVTDVAIAFSLGFEQPEADLMERPPRPYDAPIVSAGDYRRLLSKGALISTAALGAHLYSVARHGHGGGIALLSLVTAQLLDGLSSRSETQPFWQLPGNPSLNRSLWGLAALQAVAGVLPVTRGMLGIKSLDWLDLGVIGATSLSPFIIVEAQKALQIDLPQYSKDTPAVMTTL